MLARIVLKILRYVYNRTLFDVTRRDVHTPGLYSPTLIEVLYLLSEIGYDTSHEDFHVNYTDDLIYVIIVKNQ